MKTLYLRNVPDEVVSDLQAVAARDGLSVNTAAVRELAASVRLRRTTAVLHALPDRSVALDDIVAAVREGRDR